jgi:hypothetical protein
MSSREIVADDPTETPEPVATNWWSRPAGRLVRAGLVAVLVAVGVAWFVHDDGTASDAASGSGAGNGAAGVAAPAARQPTVQTIEQLAAAAGCRPKISAENTGYRQAVCQTPAARLVLTTFATDKGQRDWLSDAVPYGGAYLVGLRWVVNGSYPTGLPELAARLGGTIVDKSREHRHS